MDDEVNLPLHGRQHEGRYVSQIQRQDAAFGLGALRDASTK